MFCFLKNIPENLLVTSGNRGTQFPYNQCVIPEQELCYLISQKDDYLIQITQEDENLIYTDCV